MLTKKVTRKEFLKTGFLGLSAIFALQLFRIFSTKDKIVYKEAKYYKNLAG